MDEMRVEHFSESDRIAVSNLIESSHDFPQNLKPLYHKPGNIYPRLVAWFNGNLVGLLDGALNHDFHGTFGLESVDLPEGPHALLTRIFVHDTARCIGIGGALLDFFQSEAAASGCTFMGGSIDRTSDVAARIGFFENEGFDFYKNNYFGMNLSKTY